jgi:hypothetical protein
MAIYYLVASKRLSTGQKVKKYDEKTRNVSLVLLFIMAILIVVNVIIISLRL